MKRSTLLFFAAVCCIAGTVGIAAPMDARSTMSSIQSEDSLLVVPVLNLAPAAPDQVFGLHQIGIAGPVLAVDSRSTTTSRFADEAYADTLSQTIDFATVSEVDGLSVGRSLTHPPYSCA